MKSGGKTFDSEVWAKLHDRSARCYRKTNPSTAVIRVADGLDADAGRQGRDRRFQESRRPGTD